MARKKRGSNRDATPKLLTGGNPQIPKGDGDGPVQMYIDAMPGWKREVGRKIDDLVVATVPNVRKAVRWNSPFYGIDDQGWFLSFYCFTRYVKLTFHNGVLLSPLPPIASKHESVRYFRIDEGDAVDEGLIRDWIKQASALPGENLF